MPARPDPGPGGRQSLVVLGLILPSITRPCTLTLQLQSLARPAGWWHPRTHGVACGCVRADDVADCRRDTGGRSGRTYGAPLSYASMRLRWRIGDARGWHCGMRQQMAIMSGERCSVHACPPPAGSPRPPLAGAPSVSVYVIMGSWPHCLLVLILSPDGQCAFNPFVPSRPALSGARRSSIRSYKCLVRVYSSIYLLLSLLQVCVFGCLDIFSILATRKWIYMIRESRPVVYGVFATCITCPVPPGPGLRATIIVSGTNPSKSQGPIILKINCISAGSGPLVFTSYPSAS
jgi:hypothetical protein